MMDERLSAFLDGECDADELQAALGALARDPALRTAWQRQLWVREALRSNDRMPDPDAGFADRVIALLAAEDLPSRVSRTVSIARHRRPRWYRAAAGLAAAASVAAAVVLVDNPLRQEPAPGLSAPAGSTTVAAQDVAEEVAEEVARDADRRRVERVAVRRQPVDHWAVSDPAIEDQLNSYLIEHSGLARGYGLSGATPSFLRVAAYGQAQGR